MKRNIHLRYHPQLHRCSYRSIQAAFLVTDIKGSVKLLLIIFAALTNVGSKTFKIAVNDLVNLVDINLKTYRRNIKILEDKGYISTMRVGNRTKFKLLVKPPSKMPCYVNKSYVVKAIALSGLTTSEKLLLLSIGKHMHLRNNDTFVQKKKLMKETCMSERQFFRVKGELIRLGILNWRKNDEGYDCFSIHIPPLNSQKITDCIDHNALNG